MHITEQLGKPFLNLMKNDRFYFLNCLRCIYFNRKGKLLKIDFSCHTVKRTFGNYSNSMYIYLL